MASAFIKRLDIVGVEGLSKAAPTQYLKIVNIVGFEKNDGSPWIPEPQYEDLAVVSKSSTTGSTVLGSTLTGTPAVFTGGTPTVEATEPVAASGIWLNSMARYHKLDSRSTFYIHYPAC